MIDELYIDEEGRFQMAAADLEEFIRFLRDHEVRVDVETADVFRSGGGPTATAGSLHLYDADSVDRPLQDVEAGPVEPAAGATA